MANKNYLSWILFLVIVSTISLPSKQASCTTYIYQCSYCYLSDTDKCASCNSGYKLDSFYNSCDYDYNTNNSDLQALENAVGFMWFCCCCCCVCIIGWTIYAIFKCMQTSHTVHHVGYSSAPSYYHQSPGSISQNVITQNVTSINMPAPKNQNQGYQPP